MDPASRHHSPRQTQSYLRALFSQNRLQPKSKLGQNFLIDLNLVDFVVQSAELSRADLVLEVGTGTGGLTVLLAERAGSVVSVEIDGSFYELAKDNVGPREHVTLLHTDVLKNKNTLNPVVMEAIEESRTKYQARNLKLIANLPYAVATPVITNLLLRPDLPIERMVVMVQWEIAEKMIAQPRTKDYGALAVLVQSLADVTQLRRLPPSVFWPKPAVDSGIVLIKPNLEKRKRVPNVLRFRAFLRDLYSHRRKNLRGALVSMPTSGHDKAFVDTKLLELGFDGTDRAETLDLDQHLVLAAAFGEQPKA